MKISIIIPVYNAACFLPACLDSILSQDYANWEAILVNDGSTDGSPAICDDYAHRDSRFKVFHKENGGVSSARNMGLEKATGEWITFIDADDLVTPRFLPSNLDPSIDLYLQNWRFADGGQPGEVIPSMTARGEAYLEFLRVYAHWDICRCCCSKFIKKEIVDKYGIRFDTNMRLGEDTLFFMEYYARSSSVAVLDTGWYEYNRPSEEVWTKKYRMARGEVLQYYDEFEARYRMLPVACPSLAAWIFDFFPGFLAESDRTGLRWRLQPSVLKMRGLIRKKTISEKVKSLILNLLSKFLIFLRILS